MLHWSERGGAGVFLLKKPRLRYALLVGLVAGLKPLTASSKTTAEFVWDGDLRARHGLGDVGKAVGSQPADGFAALRLYGNAREVFRDLQAAQVDHG